MYRPKYHALTDIAEMQAHIDQHSLGAWVCTGAGELIANHIPFVLEREDGQLGRLTGHVSRANPVWRQLASDFKVPWRPAAWPATHGASSGRAPA